MKKKLVMIFSLGCEVGPSITMGPGGGGHYATEGQSWRQRQENNASTGAAPK
eukprot:gene5550-6404_t